MSSLHPLTFDLNPPGARTKRFWIHEHSSYFSTDFSVVDKRLRKDMWVNAPLSKFSTDKIVIPCGPCVFGPDTGIFNVILQSPFHGFLVPF